MDDRVQFRTMLEERRRRRERMLMLRWVLVALSALLAVVLVAAGAVVIGVLIGAMALVRAVLFLQWRRHAQSFRPGARHLPHQS
jgi:Flp pilus assembly protein TadB